MTTIEQDISNADTAEEFQRLASEGALVGVICACAVCNVCGARSRGWRVCCFSCGEGPNPPDITLGYLVQKGSDPEHPEDEFMDAGRVAAAVATGRRAVDLVTLADVPLHDETVLGI